VVNKTGTVWEYACRDYLQAMGLTVLRAAGSHGAADLIAWDEKDVLLIQCKKESVKKSYGGDVRRLREMVCPKEWRRQLWVKSGRGAYIYDLGDNITSEIDMKIMRGKSREVKE